MRRSELIRQPAEDGSAGAITGRTVVSLLFTIAYYLILILSNLFFARHLGDELYGDFAFVTSAVLLGSQLVLLGGEETAMRFVPRYLEAGEHGKIAGLVRFFVGSTIVLCLLSAAFVWTLIFEEGTVRPHITRFEATVQLLSLVALCLPLYACMELGQKILRSFGMWAQSFIPNRLVAPGMTLAVVALVVYLHLSLSVWTMPIAIGIGSAIALVLQLVLFHRAGYPEIMKGEPQYKIRPWLSFSVPMMLIALMWKIIAYGDIVMLELIGPDEASVGEFAAAQSATLLFSAVHLALATVMAPTISVASRSMDHDDLQRLVGRVVMIGLAFAAPLCVVMILFRHQVMGLFGPDYMVATGVLVILTVGFALNLTLGSSKTFLEYMGWPRLALWPTALAAITNVVLDAILIPLYGIEGAAMSTAAVLVASALGWCALLYRAEGLVALPLFRRTAVLG